MFCVLTQLYNLTVVTNIVSLNDGNDKMMTGILKILMMIIMMNIILYRKGMNVNEYLQRSRYVSDWS